MFVYYLYYLYFCLVLFERVSTFYPGLPRVRRHDEVAPIFRMSSKMYRLRQDIWARAPGLFCLFVPKKIQGYGSTFETSWISL